MQADAVHLVEDGELARRIGAAPAGGTPEEEAELYRRFATRVRLYGRRHLRDDAAAQDLAQDVLLVAIERLREGAVHDPDRIGSFILSTARLMATTRARTGSRRAHLAGERPVPAATGADFEDAIDLPRVSRCLDTLEAQARQIVILTYYADQTAAQIATELGSTGGAVRVARHRAMERLRDCMGVRRAG
jgi:RNA polymerase sigma-70 factor (ECF subfamily)